MDVEGLIIDDYCIRIFSIGVKILVIVDWIRVGVEFVG